MSTRQFSIGLLALLLGFLPFHTFLITALDHIFFAGEPDIPFVLAAWKEILLALFILIAGIRFVREKNFWQKLDILDYFIIAYVLWALATGIWRWETDWLRTLWGAKYSLSFLVFFFFLRHFSVEEKVEEALFQIMLLSGAMVLFFGLAQKFLPADFLTNFGYASDFSTFDPNGLTAYCQKISFTDTCRLQSFFSGPNQFSAYLSFLLPVLFFLIFHSFKRRKEMVRSAGWRAFGATFFLIGIFCLFFAYSRSAWGGFLVSMAAAFILLFRGKKWFRPLFLSGLMGSVVLGSALLFAVPKPYTDTCARYDTFAPNEQRDADNVATKFFCKVIYRGSSSQGHFERSRDGIAHILMHPLGTGLGDSGPASARFYDNKIGFIPESWYLQVGIDTGWPGLILFLGILFLVGKKLLMSQDWRAQALFCGLLGISIMALKLHAWEDASTALTFWGAAGIVLAPPSEKRLPVFKWMKNFFKKYFRF